MSNANKIILKFLGRILLFSGFSILMYCVYLIIWGSLFPISITKNMKFGIGAYGHLYSRLKEADTIKNVDILFIGSSHSYRGYDPRVFKQYHLKTINLGSSAQPPIVSQLLINNYLPKIKPKLVIIDIFPNVFTIDGTESELDYFSNSKPNLAKFELALKSKNIKTINTFLYSIFYNSMGLFDSYQEEKVKRYNRFNPKEYDTYISGGFVQTSLTHFDSSKAQYSPEKVEMTDENIQAFENILKFLKENKINYILVQAPITKKLYESTTNNKDLNKKFSRYGSYYDFNEILNFPDTYFFDSNHLNQKGVNLYNQELIKTLQKDSTFISTLINSSKNGL